MNPQITNDNPEKIKNPKRVAQGKKLALISRESKERKKREQSMVKYPESSSSEYDNPTLSREGWGLLGFVGLTAAFGVFYMKFFSKPENNNTLPPIDEKSQKPPVMIRTEVVKKNLLQSFD